MARKARTPHRIRQIAEETTRRVAIYIRRSTDEDHQPFTLEAQETKLRAFVASQPGDWQIVAVYSDDASGATTERRELQKHSARHGPDCSTPCWSTESTGSPAACATSPRSSTTSPTPTSCSGPRPNRSTPPPPSAECSYRCSACSPNSNAKPSSTE